LCKEITIDRAKCIQAKELKGFVQTLKEMVVDGENTSDDKGMKFSLRRLAKSISIGVENSRILFIDSRDNSSLWVFHPDGGDVEKTNLTIEYIIGRKHIFIN
jgi:hypothetical protein